MDFWTDIAFTVILRIAKDKKQIKQFAAVLRKVYLNLHANRLLFLTEADRQSIGDTEAQ